MVFIKFINKRASFIHYLPFDEKHGLGKTETELLEDGVLLETLPEHLPDKEGYMQILYSEPIRWEYELLPDNKLTIIEKLFKDGKITQEEMNELL